MQRHVTARLPETSKRLCKGYGCTAGSGRRHSARHVRSPAAFSSGFATRSSDLIPQLPDTRRRLIQARWSTSPNTANTSGSPDEVFKARVVEMFDKRAAVYDNGNTYHTPMAAALVSRANLKPGERVLDMATGTGFVALLAGSAVGEAGSVLGVDLSSGMLQQAAAKASAEGLQHVAFTQGDVEALDFPPASFDAIFCATALMYMTNTPALLKKALGWLAPGGRLVFNAFKSPQNPTYGIFCKVASKYGVVVEDPTELMGRPDKCRTLLEAAGYTNISVDVEVSQQDFKADVEDYVERIWRMSTMGPWHVLSELTDDITAERIKKEYMTLATRDTLQLHTADKGVVFPVEVYYVTGLKPSVKDSRHPARTSSDAATNPKAWSGVSSSFAVRHPVPLRSNQPAKWASVYPGFSGSSDDEPTEVELIFQEWLQKEQDYLFQDNETDTETEFSAEAGTTLDWEQYTNVPFIPDIPFNPPQPYPCLTPQLAGNAGAGMLADTRTSASRTSSTSAQAPSSADTAPTTRQPAASSSITSPRPTQMQPYTESYSPENSTTRTAARSSDIAVGTSESASRQQTTGVASSIMQRGRPPLTTDPAGASVNRTLTGTEQLLADGEKLLMGMETGDEEAMLLRVQRWAERDDLAQRQRELLAKLARKLQRSGMRKGKYEAEPYAARIRDPLQFVKPAIVVLMIPFVALMFAMFNGFQGAPI